MCHINELLKEFDLDILCLTETWLYSADIGVIRAALPESFSISHVPRATGVGGGVALLHKSAINIKHVVNRPQSSSFELMEARFQLHGEVTHIYIVYRPGHPGTDLTFIEEFGAFLESLLMVTGRILICGDFNYWVDEPASKPFTIDFLELLETNNIINHVSSPTHLRGHTLDLILTPNETSYVRNIDVLPIDTDISDHCPLIFLLKTARPKATKKYITFRSYRNLNHSSLSRDISLKLSVSEVGDLSAMALTDHYNRSLTQLEEQYFPLVTKQILVKSDSPWYDHTIAPLRRLRRKAERKWRSSKTEVNRMEYLRTRRAVVKRVQQCKIAFYREKWAASRGDQKKLAYLANTLMKGFTPVSLPTSTSESELASNFMGFFQSKIEQIRLELDSTAEIDNPLVAHNQEQLIAAQFTSFSPVSEQDVLRYIRKLNKTYCQSDPINVRRISGVFESAAPYITLLTNQCFAEGAFPESEKLALLRPQLKKVDLDCEDMRNYRPISNLTFLSKILECAVLDQLLPFLEQNNIVTKYQSAYRKLHSTETTLCRLYNDVVLNSCSGRATLLVLLDLSAAFDTIDHDLLLSDLYSFGIAGDALSLLKSYLKGRLQRVVVGASQSEAKPLRCGVPQGSILGPVLFILYTSSLAMLLEAHGVGYHLYANDTQIYVVIDDMGDLKERVLSLLKDLKNWMLHRKLKLNEGKTDIILLSGGLRVDPTYAFGTLHFEGSELCPSTSVRNLGIVFDCKLNFRSHISNLVRSCNYHLRNLYSVKRYLDRDILTALIHSLIVSRVDYCNSLFLGLPNAQLKKIQSILNRCARLVFSLPPRVPTTKYLIELHWLSVKARIEFKICLIVFKALKFGQPKYIVDLLSSSTTNDGPFLRRGNDPHYLHEPRAVNERAFADRSFSYVAPRLYNRLPLIVKQQTSLVSFKSHLKTHLFSQSYDLESGRLNQAYCL